jgi:hypothetical protein
LDDAGKGYGTADQAGEMVFGGSGHRIGRELGVRKRGLSRDLLVAFTVVGAAIVRSNGHFITIVSAARRSTDDPSSAGVGAGSFLGTRFHGFRFAPPVATHLGPSGADERPTP